MLSKKFQISGVVFQILLPHEIEIKENFFPFVMDISGEQQHVDCMVCFEEKRKLPCYVGKILTQNDALRVVRLTDSTWVRYYLDYHDKNRYVSLGRTLPNGSILVEFLPEAKKYLSNSEQVFFHIAMEEQLLRHGRWIVHASCVKTPLGAVLFVGPSGIGKTTQAELWERYRGSEVLNGDRTILYQKNGVWYAAGSPYAGSSKRYVNESAPVCGVVLLEQGTENQVRLLSPGKAFQGLYPHLTVNDWNPWYVETIIKQLELFIKDRPVFQFRCTPDETAVEMLWRKLTEEVEYG